MSRRVIEVSSFPKDGKDHFLIRLIEPPDIYEGNIQFALTCRMQDPEFAALNGGQLQMDAIRLAGQRLRESLIGQSAVNQAIQEAISQAKLNHEEIFPIYLHLTDGTQAIESLPWEMLYDKKEQFLALDRRWPIGRISGGLLGKKEERTYNLPIRILAFLSAAGIQAQGEWDALYTALFMSDLPIDLRVFIAEPDLAEHIDKRAKSSKIHVEVTYLSTPFDFAKLIENADVSPHIIHFFCHGSTDDGPSLKLATFAGWENDDSDIPIEPKAFEHIPDRVNHLWLVTLNCCEGAAVGGETSSFARTLVAEFKVPAVVAMREPIKVEDGNIFCGAFYTALLREIKPSLKNDTTFVEVEWVRALYDPRFSICNAYAVNNSTKLSSAAAASKEWALPVIYVRAGEFKLRAISPQSPLSIPDRLAKRAEIEQLQRVLDELPEETPREAIAAIKQRIASIESELLVG